MSGPNNSARPLLNKLELFLQKKKQVGSVGTISISNFKPKNTRFPEIIASALSLIKECDPVGYGQVTKHISWVVNETLPWGGASYSYETLTCSIDFVEPVAGDTTEYLTAWYARTLIHESTHGRIRSRNVKSLPELRARIERACVRQENRFIRRLSDKHPNLGENLLRDFDESDWKVAWNANQFERLTAYLIRLSKSGKT